MADKIIDVSSNNNSIDWRKAAGDGVTDVIIRLSLGTGTVDKKAATNAKAAQAAGIRVSYYHLGYPDHGTGGTLTPEEDAAQEAGHFTSLFGNNALPAPRWLAIDLEKMSTGWDTPLNKTDYLNWLIVFLNDVYNTTGIPCMIYSNKPYLDAHLPASHTLGKMHLWIANYNKVSTPPLPKGWTDYFLWQYTAKATINGIPGPCDMSKTAVSLHLEKLRKKVSTVR